MYTLLKVCSSILSEIHFTALKSQASVALACFSYCTSEIAHGAKSNDLLYAFEFAPKPQLRYSSLFARVQVAALCEKASSEVPEGQGVRIANFLCPGNYAVSGGVQGCEVLERIAKPEFKVNPLHRFCSILHERFYTGI